VPLTARQREVLHQIGIPIWVPRHSPVVCRDASPGTEPARTVAEMDWEGLKARVAVCTACADLAGRRTQTVFGVGDPDADWLFIGEAPGAEEDRRGEPFVGRAGQLLDNMLAALGLRRGKNVYIANILKCRPPGTATPRRARPPRVGRFWTGRST
jgi:uracil-DNA glycosylase